MVWITCLLFAWNNAHANSSSDLEMDRQPASVPNRVEELKGEDAERPKWLQSKGRKDLEDSGLILMGSYLGDFGTVLNQADNEFRNINHFYVGADLDMSKLVGWQNGRIVTSFVGNIGKSFSPMVGDFQFTSNIESGADSVRPYEFFLEQKLLNEKLSIMFGLFDINSEFNVTPGSLLFLNSSFGMDAGLAASGFAGPSTFPMTTLGLRAKYQLDQNLYFQSALTDGKPGPVRTFLVDQFRLSPPDEGFFHIHEFGYGSENADAPGLRKLAMSMWSYTKEQPYFDPSFPDSLGSPWGAYLIADYGVTEKYSVFFRYGISNKKVQFAKNNLALGFVAKGIFGDLDHDRWGLGLTRAGFSDDSLASESTLEVTSSWRIADGFYLQPNFQYVLNPSGDQAALKPLVATVRLEVNI